MILAYPKDKRKDFYNMKKISGLMIALIMALSLFGCHTASSTRTRMTDEPYSTTRTVRRETETPFGEVTTRKTTTRRADTDLDNSGLNAPLGNANTRRTDSSRNSARGTAPTVRGNTLARGGLAGNALPFDIGMLPPGSTR